MSQRRRARPGVILLIIGSSAVLAFPNPSDARPGVRRAATTSIARPAPRPVPPARTGEQVDAAARNRVDTGDRVTRVGHDVNLDIDNDASWGEDRHPVAAGVVLGAAAARTRATSVVIGSIAYSLPPDCATSIYSNESYYTCDGVWYAPRYQGDDVVYVAVEDPSH